MGKKKCSVNLSNEVTPLELSFVLIKYTSKETKTYDNLLKFLHFFHKMICGCFMLLDYFYPKCKPRGNIKYHERRKGQKKKLMH